MKLKKEFIVSVYGRMQIEMIAIDLLTKDGVPKPTKHMNAHEKDAIAIYNHISYEVKGISKTQLNEIAQFANDISKKLINDNTMINNYLLSLMLYRSYLQDEASKFEQGMLLPKVERQLKIYENLEGDTYSEVRKTTSRVADNIWRVFIGKAQLSDEIRDIRANKFKRSA